MTISQATSELAKPIPGEKIPEGTLGYFRTRNRYTAHSVLLDEFDRSGITQKELARRLGKGTDVVCRWLGAPGNYGVDTLSDLLFAISGAALRYSLDYPLDEPARNSAQPDWLANQSSGPAASAPLAVPPQPVAAIQANSWIHGRAKFNPAPLNPVSASTS